MSWRRLRALVRREVLTTLRDPFTVTILITVPLVALLTFGFILSVEVDDLPLVVLDGDGSAASRQLVADLAADGTFVPRRVLTRAALSEALVSGEATVGLVIPTDFERRLAGVAAGGAPPEIQAIYDGAETVLAGNAEGALGTIIAASGARLASPGGPTASGVEVVDRALFNPTLDGKRFMVAGVYGFVLSFLTTLITAVSIVNERLSGTFDQLQVTPATSLEIFLGKVLPLGAVFTFDVGVMMLVAGLVLGVWPTGSALFFFIVSAFYVLTSLALGLIFSATSATAAEAIQKTVLFSIPLIQLSGFAFPIRNMPEVVQWFTQVFPATHYVRFSHAVYLRGEGPLTLLPELGMLALFGVGLAAIALRTIAVRP